MKKFHHFLWVSLIHISLIASIFFSQNSLALAAPIKLSGLVSSRLSGTNLLGFTTVSLNNHLSNFSDFSQCEEIGKMQPIEKLENLGDLDFPVSTSNPKAQEFFNQGMTLFYSFNDEDAIRSFEKATDLDPNFAMAYYGMALAAGSNINIAVDQICLDFAREKIQQAHNFAQKNVQYPNRELEKQLIDALVTRYKYHDKKAQDENYVKSMKKVYKNYSTYPDVAVLYTDSLMNLHPWQLWKPNGNPAQKETNIIVKILETSLEANLKHLGLNHYYIHVMEASKTPDKALFNANILTSLAPAAGHINHMPSHIYARVGNYKKSAEANEDAVRVDQPYVDKCQDLCSTSNNCVELYTGHYNTHDLLFTAVSYAMIGDFDKAWELAQKTTKFVEPFLKNQPGLIHYVPTDLLILE